MRMDPITIVERKTLHARKKFECGEEWFNDPKSHSCDMLGKGKRRSTEVAVILPPSPLKNITRGLIERDPSII